MANGGVINQAEASQTAQGTFFNSNTVHRIKLTEGLYRFAISSGVDEHVEMSLKISDATMRR
jgi:hypothetical protein